MKVFPSTTFPARNYLAVTSGYFASSSRVNQHFHQTILRFFLSFLAIGALFSLSIFLLYINAAFLPLNTQHERQSGLSLRHQTYSRISNFKHFILFIFCNLVCTLLHSNIKLLRFCFF